MSVYDKGAKEQIANLTNIIDTKKQSTCGSKLAQQNRIDLPYGSMAILQPAT